MNYSNNTYNNKYSPSNIVNSKYELNNQQTLSFNKEITASREIQNELGVDKESVTICNCYCTIIIGQGISFNMTIEDYDLFNEMKDSIQQKIDDYKNEAIKIARENGVQII